MRGTAGRGDIRALGRGPRHRRRGRTTAALAAVVASVAAGTVPGGASVGAAGAPGEGDGDRFAVTVLSGRARPGVRRRRPRAGDPARAERASPTCGSTSTAPTSPTHSPTPRATARAVGLVDGAGRRRQHAAGRRSTSRRGHDPSTTTTRSSTTRSAGPSSPGPQQQPFVCTTARGRFDGRPILGQPLVDNQDSFGIPVAAEAPDGSYPQDGRGYPTAAAQIVGWSGNCAADTRYGYVYRSTTDGRFHWLDDPAAPPADVATTTTHGRPDRAVRRPLGAGHDQPLRLQRRHAGARGRGRSRPRPTTRCGTAAWSSASRAAWASGTSRAPPATAPCSRPTCSARATA